FRDNSVGWIGGTASVLRTTSGGSSWGGTQINIIGGSTTRYSIFGVSDTVSYQVGSLYRYTLSLGGGSVSTFSTSSGGSDRDLHMFDADNGIAVGLSGHIARIANGTGSSSNPPAFTTITAPTSSDLFGLFFVDANVGYAVGGNGTILKTTNGGSSWSLQSSGTTNPLRAVHFRDANIGWAVGDAGIIVVTVNGGATWAPEASGTSNHLRGVFAAPSNTYAVGAQGTVLKRAALSILLSSVNPDRGPTYGGTPVTIRGSGFKSGARVRFGGVEATSVNVVDASTITCVTPFHAPGSVDIVVTNSDNTTATLPRSFLYAAGPHRRPARR
ncbi:MAG TPA: IPT/TIG domain-containing protein, partial [Thermoanaerobaculia bacterium]